LLLAARERAAAPIKQALQTREQLERLLDDAAVLARPREAAHAQVVEHAQRRKDLASLRHEAEPESRARVGLQVRDVVVQERHAPCGRRDEAHQGPHQRGLSHAVVTEDAEELPGFQQDVDAHQDRNAAVAGAQCCDFEHHAAFLPR